MNSLDTLATINLEDPDEPLSEGGTFLMVSWEQISESLRMRGIIHPNETVAGVRVTEHGASFKLEPSSKDSRRIVF